MSEELARAAGTDKAPRLRKRLESAARAYDRQRFHEARAILQPLVDQAPGVATVRELLGLTYYRLGRWREAIRQLKANQQLSGTVDQHPVLADCHRALGHHPTVDRMWEELRQQGVGVELLTEGRIVVAGSLADRGRVPEAVTLLEAGPVDVRKPKLHHLRLWYALASMYERGGDVQRARSLYRRLLTSAPGFADAESRLAALS